MTLNDGPRTGGLAVILAEQAGCDVDGIERALAVHLAEPDRSLPVAPSSERGVWDSVRADAVVRRARAEVGAPWSQPLASDAARFHRDGDRRGWEVKAFERTQRLSRAAVAAAITDEQSLLDEAIDGIVLVCEQSSWCWPAHDDAFARRGFLLGDVTDPYLDLGAGEVAGQMAWIDQLLGPRIDERMPGLRKRIRDEVCRRVLDPFVERDDWWWTGRERTPNNWNPWICQNVLAAALRLLDAEHDRAARARTVAMVIERIDRYAAVVPDDGAIDEGSSYWWAGASRLLETLDALTFATDGLFDGWTRLPALRHTVAFPHRMQLSGAWYVSVADSRARDDGQHPWRALFTAARRVGDEDAAAFATAHRVDRDEVDLSAAGLGRQVLDLVDADWRDAPAGADPLPAAVWLPSTQMLVARERAGSVNGLTVVAKAGHNGESHNHNDVGSVILASDGRPLIVDAGQPTYTRETFDGNRYSSWVMQSGWHSVPLIDGIEQSPGAEFAATDVHCDGDDELQMELAAVYGLAGRVRWQRSIRLDREERRVCVTDRAHWADGAARPCQVRFVLCGEVTLRDGVAIVAPREGDVPPIDLRWDKARRAQLHSRTLDDPRLRDIWGPDLVRLEIDGPGEVQIRQLQPVSRNGGIRAFGR